MDLITNERRVDDEVQEQQVIHLCDFVIIHYQLVHGHNLEKSNDIFPV